MVTVGFIVGNGSNVIDNAGPWEVFQDATSSPESSPFHMVMISDKADPIKATGGMIITPHFTFETISEFPNLLVMGAQGEHTPAKIEWIREAAKHADVVMSVCTGAFLLAKTGLLDGLSATTHHDFYDEFANTFPKIRLIRGPRYVENGKFATAGGLTSGIELALHVVERYYGNEAASKAAYFMEYNRSPNRPDSAV